MYVCGESASDKHSPNNPSNCQTDDTFPITLRDIFFTSSPSWKRWLWSNVCYFFMVFLGIWRNKGRTKTSRNIRETVEPLNYFTGIRKTNLENHKKQKKKKLKRNILTIRAKHTLFLMNVHGYHRISFLVLSVGRFFYFSC